MLKPKTEPALPVAHRMLSHLIEGLRLARKDRDEAEARIKTLEADINDLLESASEKERAELRSILTRNQGVPHIASRFSDIPSNVIWLFAERKQSSWTAPEIQKALEEYGQPVDLKSVYNSLHYLAKTGRLQRISRGQYVVRDLGMGVEFEVPEDGTKRMSEHED